MAINSRGEPYTSYSDRAWQLGQWLPSWLAANQTSQDDLHGLLVQFGLELDQLWLDLAGLQSNWNPVLAEIDQPRLAWTWTDRSIGLGANLELAGLEYWDANVHRPGGPGWQPLNWTEDARAFLTTASPIALRLNDRLYFRNLCLVSITFEGASPASLASYELPSPLLATGLDTILIGEPVYWSEDSFQRTQRIPSDSPWLEPSLGRIWLENETAGSVLEVRYTSGQLYEHYSHSPSISLAGSAVSLVRIDLWNSFDSLGLLLGCSRIPDEPNLSYRQRLLATFTAWGRPDPPGARLGIARALGLLQQTIWTVSSASTSLAIETGGWAWVVSPSEGPVPPYQVIEEELAQARPGQPWWLPSQRPSQPDAIEVYVNQRLVPASLSQLPDAMPDDIAAIFISVLTASQVEARYMVQLWTDTGTQLISTGLPEGFYWVFWASGVTLYRLADPSYQQNYLLDARYLPTDEFIRLVGNIQRASPICWGQARWDRGIVFFGRDQASRPHLSYLPNVWESNRAYPEL